MPTRLEVRATASAANQIKAAAAWWRENRPAAPDAFAEELTRVFDLLSLHPGIGAVARNPRLAGVRRILLGRVRYHIYYRVAGDPPRVELLAFWHASRGAGPPL